MLCWRSIATCEKGLPVNPHGRAHCACCPMEHQVCEKGIAVNDGKKIAIMVYPGLELLTKPCEQAYWGVP